MQMISGIQCFTQKKIFTVCMLAGIMLILACASAYASTQTVSVNPTSKTVTAGSAVALTLSHSTSDDCQDISGVALKIYYKSALLTFNSFTGVYPSSFPTQDTNPQNDTANGDGDNATDKFVVIGWADFMIQWPNPDAPGTITLVTLNFTASATQTGSAAVNIRIDTSSMASDCSGAVYTPVPASSVITIQDTTPPTVANVTLTPNAIFQGAASVVLTANANDAGGVAAAEYSVGAGAAAAGSGTAMIAQDGSFGGTDEGLTASINTAALTPGTYTYWVRAKDAGGNWGTAVSAVLTVKLNQGPVATNVTLTPNTIVQGVASVTLNATLTDPDTGHMVQSAEYYIGSDPGEGNGTPVTITPANPVAVNGTVNTLALGQGTHQVYVRGKDNMNKWGTAVPVTLTVTACDVQTAFSFTPATAIVGQPVTFTNTSTGALASTATYDWNFGDGAVNSGVAGNGFQTHTYTAVASGLTVSLKGYGTASCSSTATQTINVICDITAGFTVDKPLTDNQITIIVNDTVNFTDTSTGTGTYAWNFGDGATDTTAGNKSHQYLTEGTFTASLTLTSSSGCTSAKQITINVLPCDVTAAFTPSARVVKIGDTVTFTNTSVRRVCGIYSGECPYDPVYDPVFDWDFDGDGTPEKTGTGITPLNLSYLIPGEYTVILTAHGANGCITTYQMNIYVNDPACAGILEASIAVSPASVEMGQAVSFTGTATGTGTPTSWSWDVNGDGTADYAVQNPSHTYPEIGTYSAILTVINGTCTAFAEKTVTVNCDVTAAFSVSSASVTAGTSVTFTNTSTGTGAAEATYSWDFECNNIFLFTPDLTTTGLTNPPARMYSTVGTFTVIMKVTSISGCTSFVQKTVTVTEAYVPPYYPVEEDTSPELTASVSGKEVSLSWTEISGAGGYKLLYAPYPDGTPVSEGDLGLVNSLRGPLPPGSAYYVAVKPYNGIEGWGEISNVTYFEIPLTFPAAPKLTVETSGDTVSASWTGVQNATGYILYYAPYPAMEPIGHADMGMQTSLSGPLPAGSAFYVAVQAYDKNGVGELSNIEHFVIPAIPESPVLTAGMNGNAVNLSWTSVNGAEGYKLIYSPFPTGDPEGVADVGNQTFIPSFTLPAGSMYYVAVQGYNSGGESQISNREVITVPALLSSPSLFVNKTGRTVSLSWTSVMNADGYTLYYLNALGKKIGELDMKKQRELSLTLPANSKFHVAVQAYNAEGKSGFSNVEYFEILY